MKKLLILTGLALTLTTPALARNFMVAGPNGLTIGQYNSDTGAVFSMGPDGTVWRPGNSNMTFDFYNGPGRLNSGQTETMKQTLGGIQMQRRGYSDALDDEDGE